MTLVRSVKVVPTTTGWALEVLSSRPLTPAIQKLDGPARLVIDLPSAAVTRDARKVDFRSSGINRIRVSQFQDSPPIVRVVIELAQPLTYTWDGAGNRLMIRLRSETQPAEPTPSREVSAPAGAGAAEAFGVTESAIAEGSSITAGSETAVLRLGQGGEVRVCPGSTVSVTSGQDGRDRMFSLGTGAFEADYHSLGSPDMVLTPDFRVIVTGPGEVHFAIQADSQGNTCMRTLARNTASAVVSGLLSGGLQSVRPDGQVRFRNGQIGELEVAFSEGCGCPSSAPPLLQASAPPPEVAPLPPSQPDDIHIQIEAPLVFRASGLPRKSTAAVRPAPVMEVEALPLRYSVREDSLPLVILPPPPFPREHRNFVKKVKGFLASLFR